MKKVIIIVVTLLVVGLGSFFIFDKVINKSVGKSDNKEEVNDISKEEMQSSDLETAEYTYEKTQDGNIAFYKDYRKYSEFDCGGRECVVAGNFGPNNVLIGLCSDEYCNSISLYGAMTFGHQEENKTENYYGKLIIYNISTGESKTLDDVSRVMWATDEIRLVEKKDKTIEFIDINNKVNKKIKYDNLVMYCYEGCNLNYDSIDYEGDYLIYKIEDKYGIQKLTSDTVLIKPMYDDMRFTKLYTPNDIRVYSKYYIAKLNGKYNLYSTSDNKQVTNNGYDNLFFVNEDLILAYKDKEISFINLNEDKIINKTIHVDNLYPMHPKNTLGVWTFIDENGICKISISTGASFEDMKSLNYTFNLDTHELVETNQLPY